MLRKISGKSPRETFEKTPDGTSRRTSETNPKWSSKRTVWEISGKNTIIVIAIISYFPEEWLEFPNEVLKKISKEILEEISDEFLKKNVHSKYCNNSWKNTRKIAERILRTRISHK